MFGLLNRLVYNGIRYRSLCERILIVGAGRTAEHIAWLLDHPTYSKKFIIAGFIDDDLLSQGLKIYGYKVIGTRADIKNIINKYDIGLIILADYHMTDSDHCSICDLVEGTSIRVLVAPDIFGSLGGLENASSGNTPVTLDSFQCQHCIARYSTHDPENFFLIPGQKEAEAEV